MSQAFPDVEVPVYDLIGVGFGPSNLALAIALTEHNTATGDAVTAHFLERQPRFGWHRGMLIEDATMQVSFLKDLTTMRDPTSRFSFLNYLHVKDRLVDFINHKNLFPLRAEFHDYFEWCAGELDDLVSYGTGVTGLTPVVRDGVVAFFDVQVPGGTYRARNVVVGTGLVPRLPDGIAESDRIWHNHDLLHRLTGLPEGPPTRFLVVGAGQSGAEVTAYLHSHYPESEVCAVFSRYGYTPSDDSAFANRIFDPGAVDDFYAAPEDVKQMLLRYHGNTNYSAVDIELIDDLYRRMYREKVFGRQRLRMFNVSRPVEVTENRNGVQATIGSLATGERAVLDADLMVFATGYAPADPSPLLGGLDRYCHRDEWQRLRVGRDYRLVTDEQVRAGIYLQGGTEHSHGITSSLLSNTAVRVGEILGSILACRVQDGRMCDYAVSASGSVGA